MKKSSQSKNDVSLPGKPCSSAQQPTQCEEELQLHLAISRTSTPDDTTSRTTLPALPSLHKSPLFPPVTVTARRRSVGTASDDRQKMFRSNASRSLLRSLNNASTSPIFRQRTSQLSTLATPRRVTALVRPFALQQQQQLRLTSTKDYVDKIDKKTESAIASQKLPQDPDAVSLGSSIHPVFGEVGGEAKPDDTDMMAGVRSDLQTIKDTFSLEEVPRPALFIGLAGVLPYVATSLSTVFCAWELNNATAEGTGVLFDGKTAELFLHVLEPIQVGYGAAVSLLAFLAMMCPETDRLIRSSLSSVLSTGVLSSPSTAASTAIRATRLVW